jgi:hypothetical protein
VRILEDRALSEDAGPKVGAHGELLSFTQQVEVVLVDLTWYP